MIFLSPTVVDEACKTTPGEVLHAFKREIGRACSEDEYHFTCSHLYDIVNYTVHNGQEVFPRVGRELIGCFVRGV
jgi:hypothetical protein